MDQINRMLKNFSADEKLIIVSSRKSPLVPYPPPGSDFYSKKSIEKSIELRII